MLLEVACFNTASVALAISAGAQRIELCSDRASGGLTPISVADILSISNSSESVGVVPIHVMVRANKNLTFTVSEADLREMKAAIVEFKPYASGFVFGVLKDDRSIDIEICKLLVDLAAPLPCTFHRAFDFGRGSIAERARLVRECGFVRILSSGSSGDAISGKEKLKDLVEIAEHLGIGVIVGGGVRSQNITELMEAAGPCEFHTSAIISDTDIPDADEIRLLKSKMNLV